MELSRKLIRNLGTGDIIIFDRLYAGANLYLEYQRAGFEFISRVHACLKVERLKVIQVLGTGDLLVEMPLEPHCRRRDPSLPKAILIRLIRSRVKIEGRPRRFLDCNQSSGCCEISKARDTSMSEEALEGRDFN